MDTALVVSNYRLDNTLRPTIKSIVDENTSTIRKNAGWIIAGLILLAIVVGVVVYINQHKKVVLNQRMLAQVAQKIEEMKDSDPDKYKDLTTSIKQGMINQDMEPDMNHFLKERHIS